MLSVRGEIVEDDTTQLETCDGEFETTFFNFNIDIEGFSDGCDDFEEMGVSLQAVIEEVEGKIPEFEGEFIEAYTCTLPEWVTETTRRFLKRRRRGRARYSYAGGGTCKKCRRNRRVRRGGRKLLGEDQFEGFNEVVVVDTDSKKKEQEAHLANNKGRMNSTGR